MFCPSCKSALVKNKLAENLTGQLCQECQGVSISLGNYLHYLAKSPAVNDDIESDLVALKDDSKNALVCECGQIMTKYNISQDTNRKLDYCVSCQSIWLDAGEWEYLKSHNMHGHINKIFTAEWQRNIRLKRTENVLDVNYEDKLGVENYKKLKEIRKWITDSKEKNLMLSYLNANDPYAVGK